MNDEHYATSDFCLATTLVASGFSIEHVDRENPRRVRFIFLNNSYLKEKIGQYRKHQLQVLPQDFYFAQKEIKSWIYSGGQSWE